MIPCHDQLLNFEIRTVQINICDWSAMTLPSLFTPSTSTYRYSLIHFQLYAISSKVENMLKNSDTLMCWWLNNFPRKYSHRFIYRKIN